MPPGTQLCLPVGDIGLRMAASYPVILWKTVTSQVRACESVCGCVCDSVCVCGLHRSPWSCTWSPCAVAQHSVLVLFAELTLNPPEGIVAGRPAPVPASPLPSLMASPPPTPCPCPWFQCALLPCRPHERRELLRVGGADHVSEGGAGLCLCPAGGPGEALSVFQVQSLAPG